MNLHLPLLLGWGSTPTHNTSNNIGTSFWNIPQLDYTWKIRSCAEFCKRFVPLFFQKTSSEIPWVTFGFFHFPQYNHKEFQVPKMEVLNLIRLFWG